MSRVTQGARRFLAWAACCGLLLATCAPAAAAEASPLEAEVRRFVEAWRLAWERQDLPAYLALHSADLVSGARDRAAFEAHKAKVFGRAETVQVLVRDVACGEATGTDEALVRASFVQEYRSPSHSDVGLKELLLRRAPTPAGFVIVRETWQPGAEQPVAARPPQPAHRASALAPAADWLWDPRVSALEPPAAEPLFAPAPDDDLLAFEPRLGELPALPPPIPGLPGDVGERKVVEEIVARINGRVLTRSMFMERLSAYQDQLLRDDPPDLDQRLELIVKETLETTIDRWLILERAQDRQADIEAFWREWLAQKRRELGAKDLDELEQIFAAEGLSLEEIRSLVIEQEVPNYFIKSEVSDRIDVSEPALRAYQAQHADRYHRPTTMALREILIPVAAGADPARAVAVTEQLLSELRAGGDWCELHARYGVAGAPCGEVGHVAVDDLIPELRPVAEGLPVGATSKPVRSPAGVHLVQVTDRSGGDALAFEEVQERVRNDLFQEAFDAGLEKLLRDLRDRAQIAVNPRYDLALAGAPVDAASAAGSGGERVVAR